jgi:hypothetical protein
MAAAALHPGSFEGMTTGVVSYAYRLGKSTSPPR